VTGQQLHGLGVARAFGGAGVMAGGGIVGTHGVNLGQRDMRIGIGGVETHGFQQQSEGFLLAVLDAVELRQVVERPRVRGVEGNRGPLFLNVALRLLIEREIDNFFPPEAHCCDPTKTRRTSITLVCVGPVVSRSPSASK
jgi:hypothetical protein